MTGNNRMLPMSFEGQLKARTRPKQRLVCPVEMPVCRTKVLRHDLSKVCFFSGIVSDDWVSNYSIELSI